MGIHAFGGGIGEVYYGWAPIKEVYYGSDLVWQKRETVVFEKGSSLSLSPVRDQLRDELKARGLDYKTVKSIPFNIDVSQVSELRYMFRDCAALEAIPPLNMSNVTLAEYMFAGCSSLVSVPPMDMRNCKDFKYMFKDCNSLTKVGDIQITSGDFLEMFQGCSSLTDGNARLIKHGSESIGGMDTFNMIRRSGMTREPFYNSKFEPISL